MVRGCRQDGDDDDRGLAAALASVAEARAAGVDVPIVLFGYYNPLFVMGVERFAAWRLIGRDFITGFLETIAGRLVAVAFPFLSPKTLVDRSPRFMRLGVKELEAKVTWRSANTPWVAATASPMVA